MLREDERLGVSVDELEKLSIAEVVTLVVNGGLLSRLDDQEVGELCDFIFLYERVLLFFDQAELKSFLSS